MNFLTTEQAATRLGVNDSRVRQLIRAGELTARQFGRAYLIEPGEVEKLVGKVGNGGKVGRPPNTSKVQTEQASKKGSKK